MDFDEYTNDDGEVNEFAEAAADEAVAPELHVKDSILFVIDARTAMCERGPGSGPSCFAQALKCVLACMRERILNGERDLVGVLLFGTEQTKVPAGHGFPHVYLLQELEEPSATAMRNLSLVAGADVGGTSEAGAAEDETKAGAHAAFGHIDAAADLDLGSVLWVTSILFNNSASKNTRRRVYLMTNDDDPCKGLPPAARARALTRSRDLQDANIWIEPFFFAKPPPATFDLGPNSFWRELIGTVRQNYKAPPKQPTSAQAAAPSESTDAPSGDAAGVVGGGLEEDRSDAWLHDCIANAGSTEVLDKVMRKAHRKRVLWQSELTIREGYALSFEMVGVVRPTARPTAKKLVARTNEELQSETALNCTVHGHTLQKEDIFKAYDFGGKWVYFDQSEVSRFGQEDGLGSSGLTLLGFKDAARLKLHHNLGPAKFLEPSERVPGSTLAMSALVHSLDAKGKIAIARYLKGKVGVPRLVALLPQLLELHKPCESGDEARVKWPCGLHLIPLPYAEDIRSLSKPAALDADAFSERQLESARELVTALTLPNERNPVGTIANPATATHYAHLQVLALNVPGEETAPIVDGTRPDVEWMERASEQMGAFKEAFELADVDVEAAAGAKRQKTAAPKVEKLTPPTCFAEWIRAHLQGRLSSLTNPLLKEFCKAQGLAVGGKKDDLLARIYDHLEAEMERDPSLAQGGGEGSSAAADVKDDA